jgi:hypothetical protein
MIMPLPRFNNIGDVKMTPFEWIANFKGWFLGRFLKNYPTLTPPPKRYPERGRDIVDGPVFKDRYAQRNDGEATMEIEKKVKEAISDLRSRGIWWKGGEHE